MGRQLICGAALLLILPAAHYSSAETLPIGAAQDASIFQNAPNNGSGAANGLYAGTNGNSSPRRALVAFDVAGQLPPQAVISDARLTLRLAQFAGSGGSNPPAAVEQTIALHRVAALWGEGATQQSAPPTDNLGTQGNGAAAAEGDATWNSRLHSTATPTAWSTAGGDFAAAPSATAVVNRNVGDLFDWSSPELLDDVRQWYADPATNFGWLLKHADESGTATFRAFYSRDVLTEANRPVLTVTYSVVPEPATLLLAVLAGGALIVIRRRHLTT